MRPMRSEGKELEQQRETSLRSQLTWMSATHQLRCALALKSHNTTCEQLGHRSVCSTHTATGHPQQAQQREQGRCSCNCASSYTLRHLGREGILRLKFGLWDDIPGQDEYVTWGDAAGYRNKFSDVHGEVTEIERTV